MSERYIVWILYSIWAIACTVEKPISTWEKALESEEMPSRWKDTFQYFSVTDTSVYSYRIPTSFKKPKQWRRTETERSNFGYWGPPLKDTSLTNILRIMDTSLDFDSLCAAKTWCLRHPFTAIPCLIARLSQKQKLCMKQPNASVNINGRCGSEDMMCYGEGENIQEDIFTISGRASWILNDITGEHFAIVTPMSTFSETLKYKLLWQRYIRRHSHSH